LDVVADLMVEDQEAINAGINVKTLLLIQKALNLKLLLK